LRVKELGHQGTRGALIVNLYSRLSTVDENRALSRGIMIH
jgi:hypothetical protein